MDRMKMTPIHFVLLLVLSFAAFLTGIPSASAGDPYSGSYCVENNRIFWFIQSSDVHIGARGDQDSQNLQWLVTQAKDVIQPSFIVVSGDLTDSTNGNLLGYPDGPHQEEWDLYGSVLAGRVDAGFYYDLPGNHDHYNDKYFSYYLANSIQGRASNSTQASWTRNFDFGKYHFIGINTADNTGSSFSLFWPYGDYAGLDASELGFIQNELNLHQDADLTLIFGHHPLSATGDSSDTYLYYGRDEFVSLMQTYGISLYGYGHTHEASESFYTQNMSPGVFYFNVASLGKSSANQYSVTAIDCNGISSITETVGTWPVVLITAPMDKYLGGTLTRFVYPVPNSISNPIRALVFDPNPIVSVQYRIDGGTEYPMARVVGNPYLWGALWNASTLPQGEHIIEVLASTGSGTRGNTITVSVGERPPVPDIKANGSDTLVTLSQGELLEVSVSLDPGTFGGWDADWWIIVGYYESITSLWIPVYSDYFRTPIFELPQTVIINKTDMPQGYWRFFFGFDMKPNFSPDTDHLFADTVDVAIY